MKLLLVITICLSIIACSSSGVLPHTRGTYTVSTSYATPAGAKQAAYEDAIDFCSEKDKEMEVLEAPGYETKNFTIIFRCY